MAAHTRAELPAVFDCNPGEGGLAEFEPEPEGQRDALWQRVDSPAVVDVPRSEPRVARPAGRRWPFIVVPVVIASAIAGATVSWVGIGAKSGAGATSGASRHELEPPAASGLSTSTAPAISEPIVAAPAAAPSAPEPAPARPPAPAGIDPAFERTLAAVSQSYRALDAESLTAVWPGADTAGLSSAFADLKYQSLSFDHCLVRPQANGGAVASCEALIAAAPKSGDAALQRRHESWTLFLDRSGERWTITGVSVR